jgi:hypothetical protein
LPKGSDAEDRQAVIDNAVQRNADHVAEDVDRPGLPADAPLKRKRAFRR